MHNVIRLVVQKRPDVGRVLQQDRLLGLLRVAAVDVELVRRGLPEPAAAVQPLLLDNVEARLVALGVREVGVLLARVEGVEEADRVRGVPLRERALQETMEHGGLDNLVVGGDLLHAPRRQRVGVPVRRVEAIRADEGDGVGEDGGPQCRVEIARARVAVELAVGVVGLAEDARVELDLVGVFVEVAEGGLDVFVGGHGFEGLVACHAEEVTEVIEGADFPGQAVSV